MTHRHYLLVRSSIFNLKLSYNVFIWRKKVLVIELCLFHTLLPYYTKKLKSILILTPFEIVAPEQHYAARVKIAKGLKTINKILK